MKLAECLPGSEWNLTDVNGTPGFLVSHQAIDPSS